MKTANYRDNAFTPDEVSLHLVLGALASDVIDVVDVNFAGMTYDEYQAWVVEWKTEYELLSNNILANKRNSTVHLVEGDDLENSLFIEPVSDDPDVRAAFVAKLKKFANTLLNAREYGKRVRYEIQQLAYGVEDANAKIDKLYAAQ
ncbi:hypothetical protein AU106_gp186 [Sinorhizobium phage phiM9]|uniref:Uncharacterized protein n=1 Tax=Sinorhizobium phage phiM9 TaxID=1636182 RepID=A0A0F6R532_9CAUD|nr:hypothetical protein AU106_gp186 [Sinorhizobium phage phiM9]AKE44817.1 hypothetical protein Sm_phiM9_190 [Sinorhizobium phage phiM9]